MSNYFYNSIELPALPDWDKEKYPYAVIYSHDTTCHLVVFQSPAAYGEVGTNGNATLYGLQFGDSVSYKATDTAWKPSTAITRIVIYMGTLHMGYKLCWSNYDILNEDGTIYLAASDPIPVVEPLDPTSFMQGYIVGRRLAGMRK